ncbi:chaperone NapD [Campylobacter mucosalis]|uniref:chaperone NapD n=1 Tax=Campylobacter mucosalis TaxID=202 RepID=UPI00147038FA|nr:chaperone NapD [Campylobacter mucosalis]
MNISSVIINLKDKNFMQSALDELSKVSDCELVANQDDKIVAVITADDVNGEIAMFKKLEAINGVTNVAMVYTYQEDIEIDKDKLEIKTDISEILTNENITAEQICYNGSVNYKVK